MYKLDLKSIMVNYLTIIFVGNLTSFMSSSVMLLFSDFLCSEVTNRLTKHLMTLSNTIKICLKNVFFCKKKLAYPKNLESAAI
jgi:hypothetical protein